MESKILQSIYFAFEDLTEYIFIYTVRSYRVYIYIYSKILQSMYSKILQIIYFAFEVEVSLVVKLHAH